MANNLQEEAQLNAIVTRVTGFTNATNPADLHRDVQEFVGVGYDAEKMKAVMDAVAGACHQVLQVKATDPRIEAALFRALSHARDIVVDAMKKALMIARKDAAQEAEAKKEEKTKEAVKPQLPKPSLLLQQLDQLRKDINVPRPSADAVGVSMPQELTELLQRVMEIHDALSQMIAASGGGDVWQDEEIEEAKKFFKRCEEMKEQVAQRVKAFQNQLQPLLRAAMQGGPMYMRLRRCFEQAFRHLRHRQATGTLLHDEAVFMEVLREQFRAFNLSDAFLVRFVVPIRMILSGADITDIHAQIDPIFRDILAARNLRTLQSASQTPWPSLLSHAAAPQQGVVPRLRVPSRAVPHRHDHGASHGHGPTGRRSFTLPPKVTDRMKHIAKYDAGGTRDMLSKYLAQVAGFSTDPEPAAAAPAHKPEPAPPAPAAKDPAKEPGKKKDEAPAKEPAKKGH